MYPNYPYYQNVAPQYNPQFQPQVSPQFNTQRKVDFVQGKTAAEVYPVDAGTEVILFDMDNPMVYRKARGFDNKLEPMETYDLVLHKDKPEEKEEHYLTEDEIQKIIDSKVQKEVDKRISEISFKPATKKTKVED